MRRHLAWPALVLAALPAFAGGCQKRQIENLSKPDYNLGLQHGFWDASRAELRKDQPNLDPLRSVYRFLNGRSLSSVERHYEGTNKQQVMEQLQLLQRRYESEVLPLLDTASPKVRLKPGVTITQVRNAFTAIEPEYDKLRGMTR